MPALGSTDMRKSINSLSMLVAGAMDLDLFSGHLFIIVEDAWTCLQLITTFPFCRSVFR